ncbi:pyruvate/2-oxoglutarate/acetoin dehydrogenase E1 component [Balneicella halophila]|uniref:3-methyl-2-oxobutanoate dehydrogenase (2-methylpropanoyl-transferring) n=1 Tax=Balneicella halophila TaxID=1537566 RepID=A0A7L4UPF6_BALHA|nr:alpha-ketoacid dehydrogenase subunit alpha/beta [Balneicella halophila]PVX51011.1 pyruvate/2-oxoglutarate/acetoin dehydrogenase E1 component [Balneicella halophila]
MTNNELSFEDFKKEVIADYRLAVLSRKLSLHGRREVLNGRAKFGILGDGKEVAQIALAKTFQKGDWRSGYYRDQTMMLAVGLLTPKEFFAQLYGTTNLKENPTHGGRLMNNHFGSRNLDKDGNPTDHMAQRNSVTDISPTAGQMPRSLGLSYASKLYRNNKDIQHKTTYSNKGNEVTFTTIGDSSTSEGHFWETLNAAGVLQVPLAVSIWDDGYGISVPKKLQTIKGSISETLQGFEKTNDKSGFLIYKAKGWDYPTLCKIYAEGVKKCREEHVPVLFHIEDMTQPQGHSTSGSHERYKNKERLEWEKEFDPIEKMKAWMLEKNIFTEEQADKLDKEVEEEVKQAKKVAYEESQAPILKAKETFLSLFNNIKNPLPIIQEQAEYIRTKKQISRGDVATALSMTIRYFLPSEESQKEIRKGMIVYLKELNNKGKQYFNTNLYSESKKNPLNFPSVPKKYAEGAKTKPGREILRNNFDKLFEKYPELVTFGEDTGFIGGVNQSLQGLQEKYGDLRVTDTGIREATIIGQGIGLAIRGLKPIAEIQYFDYLMYGLQTISDDLATLFYRTVGGQAAPLIIRTRGHRLEGVWHSGSFLSMVVNSIRGVYVCVPRNMTQAAGFYNTLLQGDNPALVIEPLNAYRKHEREPENLGEFMTPVGIPEILEEGEDITIVTYGACVAVAQEAVKQLYDFDISAELIDVQTLLPFDTHGIIKKSIKKTGKVLFLDEDVPYGTTAYMMTKVLEEQCAAKYLKTDARMLSAKAHRPAYGSDGDFFSKPNTIHVFNAAYEVMHTYAPELYPKLYEEK